MTVFSFSPGDLNSPEYDYDSDGRFCVTVNKSNLSKYDSNDMRLSLMMNREPSGFYDDYSNYAVYHHMFDNVSYSTLFHQTAERFNVVEVISAIDSYVEKHASSLHSHVMYFAQKLSFNHTTGEVSPGGGVVAWSSNSVDVWKVKVLPLVDSGPFIFDFNDSDLPCDFVYHRGVTDKNSLYESVSGKLFPSDAEIEYCSRVYAIRKFCEKNGFSKITLGASGGIDSALVLTMASDAIGGANVLGVSMPSSFSSQHSVDDARELMRNLGGEWRVIPIQDTVDSLNESLQLTGVPYENLQARVRGVIIMGVSNSEGHLVLVPGNLSEGVMGYFTMYGDSVGGFAPLRYATKTLVYEMARWRNMVHREGWVSSPIPVSSIEKPPSAELSFNQFDSDSLPPYDVLDNCIEHFVYENGTDFSHENDGSVFLAVKEASLKNKWKCDQLAFGPHVVGTLGHSAYLHF